MNQEKINKMIIECYSRLFKKAEPSADFKEMIKSGESRMPNFFMSYYLPDTKADEIINQIAKKYKLDKHTKGKLSQEILLGACPCGAKRVAEKNRKGYDKRLRKWLKNN